MKRSKNRFPSSRQGGFLGEELSEKLRMEQARAKLEGRQDVASAKKVLSDGAKPCPICGKLERNIPLHIRREHAAILERQILAESQKKSSPSLSNKQDALPEGSPNAMGGSALESRQNRSYDSKPSSCEGLMRCVICGAYIKNVARHMRRAHDGRADKNLAIPVKGSATVLQPRKIITREDMMRKHGYSPAAESGEPNPLSGWNEDTKAALNL